MPFVMAHLLMKTRGQHCSNGINVTKHDILTQQGEMERYRSRSGANALLSNASTDYETPALDVNQVRVLVVPIGNIPDERFSQFRKLILKFKAIDLSEVTPAMSAGPQKC